MPCYLVADSLKLTVPKGIFLGGYNEFDRFCVEENTDELEANIAIFKGEKTIVFVSIDLIYANDIYRNLLFLEKDHDIKLVIAASHTHSAPTCFPEFPGIGMDDKNWVNQITLAIKTKVLNLLKQLTLHKKENIFESGSIEIGKVPSSKRIWKKLFKNTRVERIFMGPSSTNLSFSNATIQSFKTPNQQVILWSFECHPTSFYDRKKASGDYISFVRKKLREQFGENTVVLFVLGICGDIRSPFYSTKKEYLGKKLAFVSKYLLHNFPIYYRPNQEKWLLWTQQISDIICEKGNQSEANLSTNTEVYYNEYSISSKKLFAINDYEKEISIQAVCLSENSHFILINAEITSALAKEIKNLYSNVDQNFQFGTCVNDCIGYLATDEEINKKTYEGDSWINGFGLVGKMKKNAGSLFIKFNQEVVNKLKI